MGQSIWDRIPSTNVKCGSLTSRSIRRKNILSNPLHHMTVHIRHRKFVQAPCFEKLEPITERSETKFWSWGFIKGRVLNGDSTAARGGGAGERRGVQWLELLRPEARRRILRRRRLRLRLARFLCLRLLLSFSQVEGEFKLLYSRSQQRCLMM